MFGLFWSEAFEGALFGLGGDAGVWKLSVRSMMWFDDAELDRFADSSFSGSGVGGNSPGMSSADVGCDERGPPPAVGGRAEARGDFGGVYRGAGMLVPAVRERSMGLRVR